MWMDHGLFNHSSTEGHLGYFQFGAITNIKVLQLFMCRFCVKTDFLFSRMKSPGWS